MLNVNTAERLIAETRSSIDKTRKLLDTAFRKIMRSHQLVHETFAKRSLPNTGHDRQLQTKDAVMH